MEIVNKFACKEEFIMWIECMSIVNEELEEVTKYLCNLQGHLSDNWEGEASDGAQAFTRLLVQYLNAVKQPSMLMERRLKEFDKMMDTFEEDSQTKIDIDYISV